MPRSNNPVFVTSPLAYGLPTLPHRAPLKTISIDIDFETEETERAPSGVRLSPDSSARIRCWCSED